MKALRWLSHVHARQRLDREDDDTTGARPGRGRDARAVRRLT